MADVASVHRATGTTLRGSRTQVLTVQLLLWLTVMAFGGMMAWLSVARFRGYNVGMLDTGNMAQAIASVHRGEPLVFTYGRGPWSRMSLHVELIYFVLGLPFALWPDPQWLLALQAGLFVLGALPVYRLARHYHSPPLAAFGLVLLYLLYPVAQTSVLWDFHGDTLAMPLLLWALEAMTRRAWRSYALFVVVAISCKFYVALPVMILGLVMWWSYGERRVGLVTAGLALIYGALAFLIIRPLFASEHTPMDQRGLGYLSFYFGEFKLMLAGWRERGFHAYVVFGPALLLMWPGWRWLLPGLPVVAAAVISTAWGPAYAYWFHHYALAVPFIIMACVVGAGWYQSNPTLNRYLGGRRFGQAMVALSVLAVLFFNGKYVNAPLNPKFWSGRTAYGMDDIAYGVTERDALKDHFLRQYVPDDVPIAASHVLAPHLANRHTLFLVRNPYVPNVTLGQIVSEVEYVVADALFDHRGTGRANWEVAEIGQMLRNPLWKLVVARDGLLVFRRVEASEQALMQRVEVVTSSQGSRVPRMQLGSGIGLVDARIRPLDGRRFRATFEWRATGQLSREKQLMAVSRLEGVPGARIIHLPTYALQPTTGWRAGQTIQETFDVELPADIPAGRYSWRVAWYEAGERWSYLTDARTRVPNGEEVVAGTIELR
jgi:uncharacterized membrane protein